MLYSEIYTNNFDYDIYMGVYSIFKISYEKGAKRNIYRVMNYRTICVIINRQLLYIIQKRGLFEK